VPRNSRDRLLIARTLIRCCVLFLVLLEHAAACSSLFALQSCFRLRITGVYHCVCVFLLQDLLQSCARGGRRRVEDMCYERRRAEACVDESAHHALVNAGGREIV
jgi:hypothetical protein